jgi:ribosomal protein S18 acetylase RimI-like enzyme
MDRRSLLPGWGLRNVEASDAPALNAYFATLAEPLSDYTFSQIFTWRNSLRLLWRELHGHLCVFANGAGDLTLLLPPIGYGNAAAALRAAFELMDDYNAQHHVPDRSRVEYASEELLTRLDPGRSRLSVIAMGHDYVYDTARMIDLAGGDLASKRQAKNRFLRNYGHRVETYDAARHLAPCLALLHSWNDHQSHQHAGSPGTNAIKRQKELLATELALQHADVLGLIGMVVHVVGDDGVESLRGFTLGERLGKDQSSIVVEKTDLAVKGLAQFIFSEFCRLHWSDRPLVNVGDDWGLETLAWTKQSYRPVKLLKKFVLRQDRAAMSPSGFARNDASFIRAARAEDLASCARIERASFDAYQLDEHQLKHLHGTSRAICRVAEREGAVVGHAIALVSRYRGTAFGRIYTIAVDPATRGQGIGRELLADAMAQLVAAGVKRVVLEVERTNQAAVRLYERSGFSPVAVLADFYGPGRDGVRMACDVAAGVVRPAA